MSHRPPFKSLEEFAAESSDKERAEMLAEFREPYSKESIEKTATLFQISPERAFANRAGWHIERMLDRGSPGDIKALLEKYNLDPDILIPINDKYGVMSPLAYIVSRNQYPINKDMAEMLLRAGAEINLVQDGMRYDSDDDEDDRLRVTPLLAAVEAGNLDAVQFLVEHRAKLKVGTVDAVARAAARVRSPYPSIALRDSRSVKAYLDEVAAIKGRGRNISALKNILSRRGRTLKANSSRDNNRREVPEELLGIMSKFLTNDSTGNVSDNIWRLKGKLGRPEYGPLAKPPKWPRGGSRGTRRRR